MSKRLMSATVRSRAFTLAELIIVMMIIVMLVAILLPALSSARARAKKVASQSQATAVIAACESYALAFNANPGYFSDAQLNTSNLWRMLTSTENLVLSLMGRIVPAAAASGTTWTPTGTTLRVLLDEVGSGPIASGRAYGAFYSPKPQELGVVKNTKFDGDNPVDSLLDTSSGMPVIYFREDPAGTVPASGTPGAGKFTRLLTLNDYARSTALETAHSGGPKNQADNSILSLDVNPDPGVPNQIAYITTNPKLSTGAINTATNVLRGSMIILSPSADGIYLSKDQLGANQMTKYDDLSKFDDAIAAGG